MNSLILYNKSSQCLWEIEDGSIDLVFIAPPFNIGTTYGKNQDRMSQAHYRQLLDDTISHTNRVLKYGGHVVAEVADTIIYPDHVFAQAAYFENRLSGDLKFKCRHFAFESTQNHVQQLDSRWQNFTTRGNSHSCTLQYLVFAKSNSPTKFEKGRVFYENAEPRYGHPCPSPENTLRQIVVPLLSSGARNDLRVLDPFMGTGTLGEIVHKSNMAHDITYIGYELDSNIFQATNSRLRNL